MVQKMAPIFENLKGNFSGSINVLTDLDAAMSPVLNTMQGDGSLSTRDLSLSGVKAIDQIADAVKQPESERHESERHDIGFHHQRRPRRNQTV